MPHNGARPPKKGEYKWKVQVFLIKIGKSLIKTVEIADYKQR